MGEHRDYRVHTAPAVLDIGEGVGALIIYTDEALHGEEIEVSPAGDAANRTHAAVLERWVNGRTVFAALFLALPEGLYDIWGGAARAPQTVRIAGGEVAQIDWRS